MSNLSDNMDVVNLENTKLLLSNNNHVQGRIYKLKDTAVDIYKYERRCKISENRTLVIEGNYTNKQNNELEVSILGFFNKNHLKKMDINYFNSKTSFEVIYNHWTSGIEIKRNMNRTFKLNSLFKKRPLFFLDFNFLNNPLLKNLLKNGEMEIEYIDIESASLLPIHLKLNQQNEQWLILEALSKDQILSTMYYHPKYLRIQKIEKIIHPNLQLLSSSKPEEFGMEFKYQDED